MASPSGSILNTRAPAITEVLNKSVEDLTPALDPIFTGMIASSQGVQSSDQMGRDYLVIKTFRSGLSGVIDGGGPQQDFALYGDPSNVALGAKVFTQGLSKTFPSPLEGPNQSTYRMAFGMRSMLGNLMFTLGEMQLEATPAYIDDHLMPKLQGFAMNMSQMLCNYFYLSQNDYYALTSLVTSGWAVSAGADGGNRVLTVDTSYSNYAIHRFFVGQRVQIYDTTGATLRTNGNTGDSVLVVVRVDELSGKVAFRSISNQALDTAVGGGSAYSAVLANGDKIVFAKTKGSSTTPYAASPYFTGIAGMNSWLKFGDASGETDADANCLLGAERPGTNYGYSGNINVNVHPEFRSLAYSNSGQPLTEHTLRKVLRAFHAAKTKYGYSVDTMIASEGVWLAYEGQKIQKELLDRTGRLSTIKHEGSDNKDQNAGMAFVFDGRTIDCVTSGFVESGTVYGIKRKNNWYRYSPPDPKGSRSVDKAPAYAPFKFIGPMLTGTGSHLIPMSIVSGSNTLVTEGTQMPCWLRTQVAPKQVCGIKITSVGEDRIIG